MVMGTEFWFLFVFFMALGWLISKIIFAIIADFKEWLDWRRNSTKYTRKLLRECYRKR